MRRSDTLVIVFLIASAQALPTLGQAPATVPASRPATTRATTAPAESPEVRRQKTRKLVTFLHGEYVRLLKNPDWVVRGLVVVQISRFPNAETTRTLLDVLKKDPHPAVQAAAWEALLSRASLMDAEEHAKWVYAIWQMAPKGLAKGRMRVGLARALSTVPPDKRAKDLFTQLLGSGGTSAAEDATVCHELGKTLAVWRSPDLVDAVMKGLHVTADAPRAVAILAAAGGPATGSPGADYAAWWKTARPNWREIKRPDGEPWRGLTPDVLPRVLAWDAIDPDSRDWYKELEVKRPDLKNFDVAFCVDVSGSMASALNWMRRDVGAMMGVLAIFAREPRIGVTAFSGPTFKPTTFPLTGNVTAVRDAVARLTRQKGGEEQMELALTEAVARNRWPESASSRKVIVFVSDENMADGQVARCAAIAADLVQRGFRIYTVCPDDNMPKTLRALARQGNGDWFSLGLPRDDGVATAALPAVESSAAIPETGTLRLLSRIVGDAITPEYRDRVIPLVAIVLAMNTEDVR